MRAMGTPFLPSLQSLIQCKYLLLIGVILSLTNRSAVAMFQLR